MIKRGAKTNGKPEQETAKQGDTAVQFLPPLYADRIHVDFGGEVALVTFTAQGQPVARLALSAALVADLPGVWQTTAARMGLFERDGAG